MYVDHNYIPGPDEWNYSQDAVQTNIPGDVVRFRDPYEDVDIDIERTPNQDTDTHN